MGLFGPSKPKVKMGNEQAKPVNRPVMLDDLMTLNENLIVLVESNQQLKEQLGTLALEFKEFMQGMKNNGHAAVIVPAPKEKPLTERVIDLLNESKVPLLDAEVAQIIGTTTPAIKRVFTDNYGTDDSKMPGLVKDGKGRWRIIKEDTVEDSEKATS